MYRIYLLYKSRNTNVKTLAFEEMEINDLDDIKLIYSQVVQNQGKNIIYVQLSDCIKCIQLIKVYEDTVYTSSIYDFISTEIIKHCDNCKYKNDNSDHGKLLCDCCTTQQGNFKLK